MKVKRIGFVYFICAILMCFAVNAQCAQIVNGNVLSVTVKPQSMKIVTDTATIILKPTPGAAFMRGQVGKELKPVSLREFAPGDRVVAVVDQKGATTSIKAFYGIIKGILTKVTAGTVKLKDGRTVKLSPDAVVTLPDGSIGKSNNLKTGSQIVCRVNPVSGVAWMIISSITEKAPVKTPLKTAATSKAKPASVTAPKKLPVVSQIAPVELKPEITSINYSAPDKISSGDIITVNMAGTPKGEASFEIKGLVPVTPMVEEMPGVYRASVKVPSKKTISNAPVIGRLNMGSMKAIPIQASRLVTVLDEPKSVEPKPQVILAVDKSAAQTETKPAPEPVIKIEPKVETPVAPPARPAIVLSNPPDGAKIQHAILVRGKADPDSKVVVTITYANGMSGILKLSGQLASENIAVGKDGDFRMGPIALEGPMATPGLIFTIKAYYSDRADHAATSVSVIGDRS